MPNNKAFTLIELLVVIAIIGLLASVVLVSMGGIKSKARITKTLEFSQSLQRNLGAYAVGIWSFDDQTNPTKDSSGYNNHGTVNGATFSSDTPHAAIDRGTGKYALSFDGANDYIDTPSQTIGNPLTIEAWINIGTQTNPTARVIASNASGWAAGQGFRFAVHYWGTNNGRLSYDNTGTTASAPGVIIPNTWQHVAVAHLADETVFLYVDGKQVAVDGVTTFTKTGVISIGSLVNGVAGFFDGSIDEVRIYERALSLGEIQKHYAEGLKNHQNIAIK